MPRRTSTMISHGPLTFVRRSLMSFIGSSGLRFSGEAGAKTELRSGSSGWFGLSSCHAGRLGGGPGSRRSIAEA